MSRALLRRLLLALVAAVLVGPAAAEAQLLNYGDPVAGLNLLTSNGEVYVNFTQAALAPGGGLPDGYTLYASTSPGGPILATDTVSSANTPFFHYLGVPTGVYWIRVVVGLNRQGPPTTADWRQVAVSAGACGGVPSPPRNLRRIFVEAPDPMVELTWDRDTCLSFVQLEAGSGPGLSDVLVSRLPASRFSGIAPAGQYYVRIRGGNQYGLSAPSNELPVTVGGCVNSAPGGLSATVQGRTVSLTWTRPPTGIVQGYNFYVGPSPGTGVLVGGTRFIGESFPNVPSGTYYVSIRGVFPCAPAEGPRSNEIMVVVP
jgi:hypothetical protein